MSDEALKAATIAVVLCEVGALLWVLVRRRGMRPVLVANLIFAISVLQFVLRYLPGEFAYIGSGAASELFDYKNTILATFETVTLLASLLAFRGGLAAMVIAWVGFAGNAVLSALAALFALTFKFKCCGYL